MIVSGYASPNGLQGHGSLSDLDLGLIVSVGSIRTSKQFFLILLEKTKPKLSS